jgi:hypothetical protein
VEIHRADKAYRNRTLLLLAVTAVLCAVLLWQLHAWLGALSRDLAASDPDTVRYWLRLLLAALGVGLALPALVLGLGLRRVALESRIEGRFPPRAWKTLRDVRVLRDAPALAWARRTELAGGVAVTLALVLLAWAGWAWFRFG